MELKQKNNKRLAWIDIAKGLGIFLVIFGHLIIGGSPISNWIFSFHMPLFFLLSGLVYRFDNRLFSSIRTAVINLIIPFFFMAAFGLLISLILPVWHPVSVKQVLREVFYNVQPEALHVGQIWFLFCMAVVQIIFVIIKSCHLPKQNEYLFIVFFAVISLLISFLHSIIIFKGHHFPRPPFKIDSAFMGLFFFYIGSEMKEKKIMDLIISFTSRTKVLLASAFLSINLIFSLIFKQTINMAENIYQNPLFFLISSISGIMVILILSILINRSSLLSFYGKNSLPIFVFHSMFLYLFAFILSISLKKNFLIMNNIPIEFCIVGFLFVSILSVPIPFLYKHTIGKGIRLLLNKL